MGLCPTGRQKILDGSSEEIIVDASLALLTVKRRQVGILENMLDERSAVELPKEVPQRLSVLV